MRRSTTAVIATAMFLVGCYKDDAAPPKNAEGTRLDVRFVFTNRGQPLAQDRLVRDDVNTLCRVDQLMFTLSGATALDDYATPVGSWPEVNITADLTMPNHSTMLGNVAAGEVHYLDVRLGPSDLLAQPTGALSDTSGSDPRWSALVIKGVLDRTDDDLISSEDEPFVIRCAMPAEQDMFRIHAHTTVVEGRRSTLVIAVDLDALLHGIDIADEPICIAPTPFNRQALLNLTNRALGE